MTFKETQSKIEERGYWSVCFYPAKTNSTAIESVDECKKVLKESAVRLRGWSYPYLPSVTNEDQALYNGSDYCEGYIALGENKEVFRFHQSGLFIQNLSLWEEWEDESVFRQFQARSSSRTFEQGKIVDIINVIYTVTEIYEFIKRVAHAKPEVYSSGINIQISLNKIQGKKLEVLDMRRMPLINNYIALGGDKTESKQEVSFEKLTSSSTELAFETIEKVFKFFNWENQPTANIKKDQENFLKGIFN